MLIFPVKAKIRLSHFPSTGIRPVLFSYPKCSIGPISSKLLPAHTNIFQNDQKITRQRATQDYLIHHKKTPTGQFALGPVALRVREPPHSVFCRMENPLRSSLFSPLSSTKIVPLSQPFLLPVTASGMPLDSDKQKYGSRIFFYTHKKLSRKREIFNLFQAEFLLQILGEILVCGLYRHPPTSPSPQFWCF